MALTTLTTPKKIAAVALVALPLLGSFAKPSQAEPVTAAAILAAIAASAIAQSIDHAGPCSVVKNPLGIGC